MNRGTGIQISNIANYSSTQRGGFAGIFIGFLLCGIGCFPPYWRTGKVSTSGLVPGLDLNVMEFKEGLWTCCFKIIGLGEECSSSFNAHDSLNRLSHLFNLEDKARTFLVIGCGASFVCLILSLISGCAACCRACCCSGGRTICHGLMTFLAGACGFVAVGIFSTKADDIYGIPVVDFNYGWSFFLFSIGSGLIVISSFLLIFAGPREIVYQQMTNPGTAMPSVIVQSSTSSQMDVMNAGYDQPPRQPSY